MERYRWREHVATVLVLVLVLVLPFCQPRGPPPVRSRQRHASSEGLLHASRHAVQKTRRGVFRSVQHLRGGTGDECPSGERAAADLARQREERKKAKAEEKLRKKRAKEATRAEWAVAGAAAAAAGDMADMGESVPEVSYGDVGPSGLPEAAFGNLRLTQV